MDTELGKKAKNDFEKDYFELMNNAVSRETMKNVRNHRDFKLITKGARRNLLAIEMEKKHTHACACAHTHTHTHIFMNKQDYVGLAILDLSKIVMYEFWYDYVKPKYGERVKLCYMNSNSFVVNIKVDSIYTDIAKDVGTRFDTSNYELDRPLP